jgi:hypothetical protein
VWKKQGKPYSVDDVDVDDDDMSWIMDHGIMTFYDDNNNNSCLRE